MKEDDDRVSLPYRLAVAMTFFAIWGVGSFIMCLWLLWEVTQ